MKSELQALQDADFGWVRSLESVWSDEDAGDAGPNDDLVEAIVAELAQLTKSPNPPGRVFLGQAGIGKTHFMGVLRRRAWAKGNWFVMLDVVGITDFWKSAALSFVTSLYQEMPGGKRQYEAVIAGVARRYKIEKEVDIAFNKPNIEPKQIVDLLVKGLFKSDPANALKYQDVFRALALLRSHEPATAGVAYAWLQGYEVDEAIRKNLGFMAPPPTPVDIVRGLLWVMGLAGATVIAVDQIDGVISAGGAAAMPGFDGGMDFIALLSGGLLDLATVTNRGMIILTCLDSSWEIIKGQGPTSLPHRFSAPLSLRQIQSGDFVRKLIGERLAPAYAKLAIKAKGPTWPFTEAAIRSASSVGLTPRALLMRCDEHRRLCIAEGKVIPCDTLGRAARPLDGKDLPINGRDAELGKLAAAADLAGLLDEKDDEKLGVLLRDVLDLFTKQVPPKDEYDVACKADPTQKIPPLHGRLTFTDHQANERERHFCFRALQHGNAVALCARFRAALTASGLSGRLADRKLIVVRRGAPPSGTKTKELFDAFRAAGGVEIDPSDADLRTFVALRLMRDAALAASDYDAFERWLVARKPLCETSFFKQAGLSPPPLPPWDGQAGGTEKAGGESRKEDKSKGPGARSSAASPPPAAAIPIGRRTAGGEPVELATSLLSKHTAIVAGAGSGKTVVLRRIVEEAAMTGVPAIVIDPNNDLSRLGEAWPERPAAFTAEDAAKAEQYSAAVEVVIWTPGIQAGNPIFLPVMPDFAAIGDDPDERAQAVTMAADTLGPLTGAKNTLQKGVLADVLRAFASRGGGDLDAMTALLAELPQNVSMIGAAEKLAAKMADELRAAVATNPLLKAAGPVVDPKLLFYGASAKRTRVSVINLSGLASDEAKQDFVNRLQMTLFGWVKAHPSPKGMIYVIDEAQLFLPSGAGALSKSSGVQLISQGRKYGLGMIVVTQAPKGVDNKVISNCSTQFLGKQNSPTDQQSVKNMIAATGGSADDIGKLAAGEFYFKTESSGKPFKVKTPICLSYHPPNPPTPEEVVLKAKRSAAGAGGGVAASA